MQQSQQTVGTANGSKRVNKQPGTVYGVGNNPQSQATIVKGAITNATSGVRGIGNDKY